MTGARRLMLAAMVVGMFRLGAGTVQDYYWSGGVGQWSIPVNWFPSLVPNCINPTAVCDVFLTDTTQPSAVTLGFNASVSSLTLNSMSNLVVDSARLTLGNAAGPGSLTNAGIIALENGASLVLDISAVTGPTTISNSGQLELDATSSFLVTGAGTNSSVALSGAGSLIMGGGTLSAPLVNASTITGYGNINTLILNSGTINNTSGLLTIYAAASGLRNSGTIQGGDIFLDASLAYQSGMTLIDNAGTMNGSIVLQTYGPAGRTVNIINNGTVAINGFGWILADQTQQLTPAGATYTWNGSGTVLLNGGLIGSYGTENLTIGSQQTFIGSGAIDNLNSIINNGTIQATGPLFVGSNSLTNKGFLGISETAGAVSIGTGALINDGIIQAATLTASGAVTNNGSLILEPGSNATFSGSLTNYNASTHTLTGGNWMFGGTVHSDWQPVQNLAGANVTLQGLPVLSGAGQDPIGSIVNIDSASSLTFESAFYGLNSGTLTNAGTFSVNGGSVTAASLQLINSGTMTVTNSGVLNLGGAPNTTSSLLYQPALLNQGTLTVDHATLNITAAGLYVGCDLSCPLVDNNGLALLNNGTVNVQNHSALNLVIGNNVSLFSDVTPFSNNGTFNVTGGSTLSIESPYNNANLSSLNLSAALSSSQEAAAHSCRMGPSCSPTTLRIALWDLRGRNLTITSSAQSRDREPFRI